MGGLQSQYTAKTGFGKFASVGECVRKAVERVEVMPVQRDGAAVALDSGWQIIAETICVD